MTHAILFLSIKCSLVDNQKKLIAPKDALYFGDHFDANILFLPKTDLGNYSTVLV